MGDLRNAQGAARYVQGFHPGAYDFVSMTDAEDVVYGWTFRVQNRDFGWMLVGQRGAGDVCTETYPYRWWAHDVATEWRQGLRPGTE